MLQHYTPPSILDHMSRLEVDRLCWMCGHCQPQGAGYSCKNALALFAGEVGVQFESVSATVKEHTRAEGCPGFILTGDPELLHDLHCLVTEADQDAREYREHVASLLGDLRRDAVARV